MSPEFNDPFDLLVASNPVPDESSIVVREGGLARVRERIAAQRRRRFRRPRWWAPPVIVVVAAAAAAGYVATREPTDLLAVGCYGEAAVDADAAVVRSTPADAVATCEQLWREGQIIGGVTEAPPLHACVLPTGGVGVFPGSGEGTCALLGEGVEPPNATTTVAPGADRSGDPAAVVELQDRLSEAHPKGAGCMSPADARRIAEELLDELDMRQWTIKVGPGATGAGFDDERPCGSHFVDSASQTVTLVPFPRVGP